MNCEDAASCRSREISFFSVSLTERQKTGFRVSFFIRDVVLPIDAWCSANHLQMTGIDHVWKRVLVDQGSCGCHVRPSLFYPMSKLFRDHSHIRHEVFFCFRRVQF